MEEQRLLILALRGDQLLGDVECIGVSCRRQIDSREAELRVGCTRINLQHLVIGSDRVRDAALRFINPAHGEMRRRRTRVGGSCFFR